jgi:hypothetical protein
MQEANLTIIVRAYGTQRGGLAEHIEEAIETGLRAHNAGAAGIAFDHDEDARLSDQLFRARRAGFERIKIELTALRALCAPVGGLDAADAQAVAFYVRATDDRPLELVLDDADKALPAFVVAKTLNEVICPTPEPVAVAKAESVAESESESESEAEPVAVAEAVVASVTVIDELAPGEEDEPVDVSEHVRALEDARGPQTLAAFERLFVQHYLPLAAVVDEGRADGRAIAAREELRRTFARAYTEALPAFALTGKRPRMVLDAFDVATKLTRTHRARTAQVLVVPSLRYDVSGFVAERVSELLGGRAALVDRTTLFSVLPSTTSRQIECLARGLDALRGPSSEREDVHANRTSSMVRRIRVGSRDLYKLDLVESTLGEAGNEAVHMMVDLVEDTARAIAKHAHTQAPKTLLLVLGDHGFRFERGAAEHGGASPEEVIVSAHAFLMGDLH